MQQKKVDCVTAMFQSVQNHSLKKLGTYKNFVLKILKYSQGYLRVEEGIRGYEGGRVWRMVWADGVVEN